MSNPPLTRLVPDLGEVGTGRVVPFPLHGEREIVLPPGLREQENIVTFTASGQCLADLGVNTGDTLICRTRIEREEIKPWTICVLVVEGYKIAKRVVVDGDRVHLYGAGPDLWYTAAAENVEVLGIVVAFQRSLNSPYALVPPPPRKRPGRPMKGAVPRLLRPDP